MDNVNVEVALLSNQALFRNLHRFSADAQLSVWNHNEGEIDPESGQVPLKSLRFHRLLHAYVES
jgi:hypothetical protein